MTAFRACATLLFLAALGGGASAAEGQLERGRNAILSLAGCYLVDYSYVETESLKPGYVKDSRVYDVNRDKSVKEWITAEALSPRRIRLRRILFFADPNGVPRAGTEIRHQSEDWEFDAAFLYDFVAPQTWQVKDLRSTPGLWTRRVTNLDDGLRYQCAAPWSTDTAYPDWSCRNYAPIPGRESRDMSRSDYNALDRHTRVVAYGNSWLERQDNIKTIHGDAGRIPLARETGKNWYVRLPDAECAAARAFAEPRQARCCSGQDRHAGRSCTTGSKGDMLGLQGSEVLPRYRLGAAHEEDHASAQDIVRQSAARNCRWCCEVE